MKPPQMSSFRPLVIRFALVFALTLIAYTFLAGPYIRRQSATAYFAYLSESWLNGRSDLVGPLPSTYDLIRYENRWYLAQPPLPSLLMMPLVAIRGATSTPDVAFTVLMGAFSAALCDLALGLFVPTLSKARHSWLTLFFALGTAHGYLSVIGSVWFTGQIAATVFLWIALLGLIWKQPWLVGVGLGAVALARPASIPGALLLTLGWWWLEVQPLETFPARFKALAWRGALFAIPFCLALAFLGWYNNARFGSPTDFGYQHLTDAENLRQRREEHGQFSPVFLPDNLDAAFFHLPHLEDNRIIPDPWGMSLFLTSPVLLYVFFAFPPSGSRQRQLILAVGAFFILLPSLLYYNTGSSQFGYRFLVDALPVLMILVAYGARRGTIFLLAGLTLFSMGMHFWGTRWLYSEVLREPWWLF
jgi:hypothetical protein